MGRILREALKSELDVLRAGKFKDVLVELVDEADDLNAMMPASHSGKYHPPHDLGYGGIVRHTKAVCMFILRFMTTKPAFQGASSRAQVAFAAGILHDLCKYTNGDSSSPNPHHPILMAEAVRRKVIEGMDGKVATDLATLADCVESHMSNWNKWEVKGHGVIEARLPTTEEDWLLVFADMAASAKWVHVEFDADNNCREFT